MARVLIVDDDGAVAKLISRLVRTQGHEPFEAASGAAALALTAQNSFDVAVLDLMMPVMSGLELARRLRAQPQHAALPIVFVTAKGPLEAERAAREMGGARYVLKPFAAKLLVEAVQSALADAAA